MKYIWNTKTRELIFSNIMYVDIWDGNIHSGESGRRCLVKMYSLYAAYHNGGFSWVYSVIPGKCWDASVRCRLLFSKFFPVQHLWNIQSCDIVKSRCGQCHEIIHKQNFKLNLFIQCINEYHKTVCRDNTQAVSLIFFHNAFVMLHNFQLYLMATL